MGTGKPLRQLMHAPDLARILLWALEHYRPGAATPASPLIVAGPELSIIEIARMVCAATGFNGELAFDSSAADGPARRTADTSEFERLCPDFAFAPLGDSMRATAEWLRARGAIRF
jgi:GDP-L-fucose synthase